MKVFSKISLTNKYYHDYKVQITYKLSSIITTCGKTFENNVTLYYSDYKF